MKENATLNSIEDVKLFIRSVHIRYPFEWHPDDDFKEFKDENGNRAFTDEEANELNSKMIIAFQFCEDCDQDIYELAGEVQIEIWKSQGLWPNLK